MSKSSRKKHNDEIIRKLKAGESLTAFSSEASWYPDRSKGFIKKDKKALEQLYGRKEKEEKETS